MKQITVTLVAVHLSIGWFLVQGFVQTRVPSSNSFLLISARNTRTATFIPHQAPQRQRRQPLHKQPRQHHSSPRYYATVDRDLSHNVQGNSTSSSLPNTTTNNGDWRNTHAQSLWLLVHYLQKERREKRLQSGSKQQQQQQQQERIPHPAKALVAFLTQNKVQQRQNNNDNNNHDVLIEPFSRAMVQALRLAGELGDYKLILHLVQSAIHYSSGSSAILTPRIFGEAIDSLSKTPANSAKLKQLWTLGTATTTLKEPLGAFELNVMIKALASRGKTRAALQLYQECTASICTPTTQQQPHQQDQLKNDTVVLSDTNHDPSSSLMTSITPDAYTLSSIFSALYDSITDDQASKPLISEVTIPNNIPPQLASRCWQWNEAISLLRTYITNMEKHETKGKRNSSSSWPPLNNHVFSNLLKLNDRISQVYTPSSHNGPRMALSLLNIMHKLAISPDVVTCTLVISNLGYQWKTAVNLLYAMKTAPQQQQQQSTASSWRLPRPNVYTYSAVITLCAHSHQYPVAMELLQEMKTDPDLESPNTWVYNAALLATTRSDSLAILAAESSPPQQNHHQQQQQQNQQEQQTYPTQRQKRSRERVFMALKLLREMQTETLENDNAHCAPDTVTYNTVLATLDGIAGTTTDAMMYGFQDQFRSLFDNNNNNITAVPKYNDDPEERSSLEEWTVHCLLDEMEASDITRDSITYRNAILAVRFSDTIRESVWRLLDRARSDQESLRLSLQQIQKQQAHKLSDSATTSINSRSNNRNTRQLDGKAAEGISFVYDTALTVLDSRGDVDGVLKTFSKWMNDQEASLESGKGKRRDVVDKIRSSQVHFIQALGRSSYNNTSVVAGESQGVIPIFLMALKGDRVAKLDITKRYRFMDDRLFQSQELDETLFSAAISSSLVANDIESARTVLNMMREKGLQPSDLSLQEIARTYSRLAMLAASDEAKAEESQHSRKPKQSKSLAKSRAQNALNIATKTLIEPPPALLSTVARTCATVGMWNEARSILQLLHQRIPSDISGEATLGAIGAAQTVLPSLHRALLRASSIQGNVTAALWYVEDIQKLKERLSNCSTEDNEEDQLLGLPGERSSVERDGDRDSTIPLSLSPDNAVEALGMTAEHWKFLLIAASKCGHWRVCMSTLQFLRPYLEETHPFSLGITVEERSRRYRNLAPALTVAVKCMEIRSQYGWAVRAIDDWIEWCGRRPPKGAVLSAIRILSARGRGTEVNSLLTRCTSPESAVLVPYPGDEGDYHPPLYSGAIAALHHEGLYDDADDVFLAAVAGNHLPFDVQKLKKEDKEYMMLDLHGMNVAVAHSAVRVALQQKVETASWNTKPPSQKKPNSGNETSLWKNDMVIVTGRGRNSEFHMRPVLRPEVQRMLLEEFYPPLSTTSMPGNMGALKIPAEDIRAWLSHQRRQKGSRMLAVASVLKNASSMDRIKQSIARAQKLQADKDDGKAAGDDE